MAKNNITSILLPYLKAQLTKALATGDVHRAMFIGNEIARLGGAA